MARQKSSWGGKKAAQQPKHRWQAGDAAATSTKSSRRVWEWRLLIALFALLVPVLVWLLLFSKKRTPVIAVSVTQYEHPVPPNAWAMEDSQGLFELSGSDGNLAVENLTPAWKQTNDGREAWLNALITQSRVRQPLLWKEALPLVIYFNMYGLVDNKGAPCLLPPGVSPLKNDLLRVDDLLADIKDKIPGSRKKLLILDCHRILVEWNMGILYNTFAERLEDVIQSSDVENLAVITSASPGQRSWASPNLHSSAFGKFLQLGLAGDADGPLTGNEDGNVSLHELSDYLQAKVGKWSRDNRAELQTPQLLSDGGEDFRLTSVVKRKLQSLRTPGAGSSRPSVDVSEVVGLWAHLDDGKLSVHQPLRYDPIGWRDFELRLLRLEQLSVAGNAYEESARREATAIKTELTNITTAANKAATLALASRSSIFTRRSFDWQRLRPHSLPLYEYFGLIEDSTESTSFLEGLTDPEKKLPLSLALPSPVEAFELTHFLVAAKRQDVSALWKRPNLVSELYQLRRRSEQLAIPRDASGNAADERAHRFVRHALAAADRARRSLEDAVFVGPNASVDLGDMLSDTRKLYDGVGEVRENANAAFATRDRVWSQAPYIAAWICRPLSSEADPKMLAAAEQERQRSLQSLLRIIRSNRQLATQLAQSEQIDRDLQQELLGLRDDFTQLKATFERKSNELAAMVAERDPHTFRALDAALAVPLMPSQKRKLLLDMRATVATLLHQSSNLLAEQEEKREADEAKATVDADEIGLLDSMDSWEEHPVLAILQSEKSETSDPLNRFEADGRSIRRYLEGLDDLREQLPAAGDDEAAKAAPHRSADRYRLGLEFLAHQIRAAASIGFPQAATVVDRLRSAEMQRLLLWHREQAIEGFWKGEDDDDPFFIVAAGDYLRGVEAIGETNAMEELIEWQTGLLNKRTSAMNGLTMKLDKSYPIPEIPDSVRMEVVVEQTSGDDSFPDGVAAIFLQKSANKERVSSGEDIAIQKIALNPDSEQVEPDAEAGSQVVLPLINDGERYLFGSNHATNLGTSPQAVAFFRGHSFYGELEAKPLTGVKIDFVPWRYGPPKITLNGDRRQRSAFMFVLDCSFSMGKPFSAVEGQAANQPGEAGPKPPRLRVAKGHLASMLDQLADRNYLVDSDETDVGVQLFGHRIAWTESLKSIVKQPDQERLGRIPAGLAPAMDVERLLPLGRFDHGHMNAVRRRIEPVVNYGQSPLYYALLQSLQEAWPPNKDTRKEIVAITDGENVQYISSSEKQDGLTYTAKEAVMSKWRQLRDRGVEVRINFLDFGGPHAKDFRTVAESTGGTYQHVTSGRDLLRMLQERLDLDGYTVEDWREKPKILNRIEDGAVVAQKLNTSLEMTAAQFEADKDYSVKFRAINKSVKLMGGEAVQLRLEESDIVAIPYDYSVAGSAPLLRGLGGDSARHLFRVHKPVRAEDSVRFKVSLQREPRARDGHFTDRPLETWLEVTPLASQAVAGPTHIFYDANFEPNEPVPVLIWQAADWPAESKQARVAFWCKNQVTKSREISLADIRNAPTDFNQYRPVSEADGITMLIRLQSTEEAYEINVFEKHEENSSPGVDTLRVHFRTDPEVQPTRIYRQFDADTGYVTHKFQFSRDEQAKVEASEFSALLIASRTAVHDGAWQLREPLEVNVYNEGGFLPLEAAAGPGSNQTP